MAPRRPAPSAHPPGPTAILGPLRPGSPPGFGRSRFRDGRRSRTQASGPRCSARLGADHRKDGYRGSLRGRRGTASPPSQCTRSSRCDRRAAERHRCRHRPRSRDRPLQDIGILVLVPVDMGQHEPRRFDRMFYDREGPSSVRHGDLEHHPHTAAQDRTALAQLHDDRRYVHFRSIRLHGMSSMSTPTLHPPTGMVEIRVREPKWLRRTAVTLRRRSRTLRAAETRVHRWIKTGEARTGVGTSLADSPHPTSFHRM